MNPCLQTFAIKDKGFPQPVEAVTNSRSRSSTTDDDDITLPERTFCFAEVFFEILKFCNFLSNALHNAKASRIGRSEF